jgi:hypothetical protein
VSDFDWNARMEALVREHAMNAGEERAFVAWALVNAIKDAKPASLPPPALKLLGALAQEAGVIAGDAPDVLLAKFDAHIEKNAPPAKMVQAFEALLREASLAGQGAQASAAFAQFAGNAAATGVLGGGERPAGTTPGGALAQMSLRGGASTTSKKK